MWQRSQVAIDGVLPMCFKITNLGSTVIAGVVWHKSNEKFELKRHFLNLRLTFNADRHQDATAAASPVIVEWQSKQGGR